MVQFTRVRRRKESPGDTPGVVASLDELVRLQFKSSGFSFLPRQPVHSVLSGRHASRLRGRGLNFEELRGYLPGDDPRSIDWKVTARTGEPHVRVYTEEKDRPVWLMVDQRLPMFFGSQVRTKSVTAAETAAVAAWRVLSSGDRVGAVVFDDHDLTVIPPHRSRDRVMQLLGEVVRMNRALPGRLGEDANPAMLNEALHRIAMMARHDCLVMLISDGFGLDPETRRHVTRISEHNDVMTGFVHDPLEKTLPDAGRLTFSDGHAQLEIDTGNRKLRMAYADDFEQRLVALESISRRFAIPLIPIHTATPVLDQLRDHLGHQAAPRRA